MRSGLLSDTWRDILAICGFLIASSQVLRIRLARRGRTEKPEPLGSSPPAAARYAPAPQATPAEQRRLLDTINRVRPRYKDRLVGLVIVLSLVPLELGLAVAVATSSLPGFVRTLAILLLWLVSLLSVFVLSMAVTVAISRSGEIERYESLSLPAVVFTSGLFFPGIYLLSSPNLYPFLVNPNLTEGDIGFRPLWLGFFLMAQGLSMSLIGGVYLLMVLIALLGACYDWLNY
jgi:hypothetical protein